jgi:hypothetical protein
MTSGSSSVSGERSSRSKSRNLSAKSKAEIKGDFSKDRGKKILGSDSVCRYFDLVYYTIPSSFFTV